MFTEYSVYRKSNIVDNITNQLDMLLLFWRLSNANSVQREIILAGNVFKTRVPLLPDGY